MRIRYFHVDAFTSRAFGGNPAGVCPLHEWLPTEQLQQIAAENNLSETAFFVREHDTYRLRWFTPVMEVDLCGHATLASAFVLFNDLGHSDDAIQFDTRSGLLTASRAGDLIELDFPARPPVAAETPADLVQGLGAQPRQVLRSRDFMALFDTEEELRALTPDMARLANVESLGIIATAPAREVDFVSRFFAPRAGIPEDPVTGSAHCTLVPFWAGRLGKTVLEARQVSRRGGELRCRLKGERVGIAGRAVLYARGEIELP